MEKESGTWDKGKGCDHFAPLGPFLATPDEITDVNQLRLWLKVNGKTMQDGNTANLIFKIPFLISYISQFMTLLPGDLISTGTPAGVGLGNESARLSSPGDVVELGIDGLGFPDRNWFLMDVHEYPLIMLYPTSYMVISAYYTFLFFSDVR